MKTNQRTSKGYYFRVKIRSGSAMVTCILAKTQKQAEEWECFRVEEGKAPVCPDGRVWAHGSWRMGTTSKISSVIDKGCLFDFLHFILSWRQEQKFRKLSVVNPVLANLGPIFTEALVQVPRSFEIVV